MGNCRGERPWLLDRYANGCGLKLKLLTRTATNTYFPQVYTVISLPDAKLYAQTLRREAWADQSAGVDLSMIRNMVAVHRSCLYGFTRFEAAPTSADGELEDVVLAVRGAPISQNAGCPRLSNSAKAFSSTSMKLP
jgi:hypothetical protein